MRTRHFSSSSSVTSPTTHRPVLLHEAVDMLDVRESDFVVDATLGGAGHAQRIVKRLGRRGLFIGFDVDADAIKRAQHALTGSQVQMHLVNANFRDLAHELLIRDVKKITKALFDLGWSSDQLDSGRGFSFKADEPLLMTYSKGAEGQLTAERVVNTWSEKSLADIIFGFGEERYARRIAKAIVAQRHKKPLRSVRELADLVVAAVPARYRHGRIHPATRTFQALRIAVNDELGALSEGLISAWSLLAHGGRIAVISFHSIEDRIVKRMFAEWEKKGEGRRLNKKPTCPTKEEVQENKAARSAKLRVIQKISNESSHSKNKQVPPLGLSGEV